MVAGGSILAILGWLLIMVGGVFGIVVLVFAFMDQIWKGIVGLLCGIYLIYWGFAEWQHEKKMLFMLLWLGPIIVGWILMFLGGGMAGMGAGGTVPMTP